MARGLLRDRPVSKLRSIWVVAVTAGAGCASATPAEIAPFVSSAKADGLPSRLWYLDRHRLHVDEPSDLALAGGRLYTVSDRHAKIYEIDRDGDVVHKIDITGSDLEAIAIDAHGDFFVGDESTSELQHLDREGALVATYALDVDDGRSGIEGLAFDDRGHLFVAQEKSPARILELDPDGDEVARTKIRFAEDLSALAFNAEDGHLYALSDQEHAVFRLDDDLEVMTGWRLPIDKPEGIAFDGAILYVASDAEERLYVFELE